MGTWFKQRAAPRPAYDVEADWTIITGCNYRCDYCFFDTDALSAKIRAVASPAQWRDAFDATGKTWLLHITGGEPTAYPDFVGLAAALTGRHFISLNTNLSLDTVLGLTGAVDPARVRDIHASFHPVERDRHRGVDAFVRRVFALREAGFAVVVSMVATPELLADFDNAVAPLRAAGLVVAPKILRSVYRGVSYPRGYTEMEKVIFRVASEMARTAYEPLLAAMEERPTIDIFNDPAFLDALPDFKGRACEAGRRFVAIHSDGGVVRCGDPPVPLGNLLDGSLQLWSEPRACDTSYCVYFCDKYAKKPPRPGVASAVLGRLARA